MSFYVFGDAYSLQRSKHKIHVQWLSTRKPNDCLFDFQRWSIVDFMARWQEKSCADKSLGHTHQKTNMAMENPPWMKMYLQLKMGIFQCHVSFQGCIPNYTHLPIIIHHFFPHNLRPQNSCKTPPADHFRYTKDTDPIFHSAQFASIRPRKKKHTTHAPKKLHFALQMPFLHQILYLSPLEMHEHTYLSWGSFKRLHTQKEVQDLLAHRIALLRELFNDKNQR